MVLKKFAPDMTGDIGARFATLPEVVYSLKEFWERF